MNKTEKLICLVLGAVLAWYIFSEMGKSKEAAKQAAIAQTNAVAQVSTTETTKAASPARKDSVSNSVSSVVEKEQKKVLPSIPEKIVTL